MELINREDVRRIVNDICNHALKIYDKSYHLPIRTITISATEQISRLPTIKSTDYERGYHEGIVDGMNYEKSNRPKGKWEKTKTCYPYCSVCEWFPEEDEMTHGLYNYCPNCGADMRGE